MNRPVNAIPGGGLGPHAAGGNQKWCGLTRQLMISSLKQLRWHWPPNRRQRRHLSWQLPGILIVFWGFFRVDDATIVLNFWYELIRKSPSISSWAPATC